MSACENHIELFLLLIALNFIKHHAGLEFAISVHARDVSILDIISNRSVQHPQFNGLSCIVFE